MTATCRPEAATPIEEEEGRLLQKLTSESRPEVWNCGVTGGGGGRNDSLGGCAGRRPLAGFISGEVAI